MPDHLPGKIPLPVLNSLLIEAGASHLVTYDATDALVAVPNPLTPEACPGLAHTLPVDGPAGLVVLVKCLTCGAVVTRTPESA